MTDTKELSPVQVLREATTADLASEIGTARSVSGSAYSMADLGSAKRTGWSGCSLSLFARYRADPTADCAGVLVTRTDRDERDKEDTEPANVLRQVVRTLIPAALADHRDRA